jgi:hypothetical protein
MMRSEPISVDKEKSVGEVVDLRSLGIIWCS